MLDELQGFEGTLKVETIGDLDVRWEDDVLTIGDLDRDGVKLILDYIKAGPKVQKMLEAAHRRANPPEVSAPDVPEVKAKTTTTVRTDLPPNPALNKAIADTKASGKPSEPETKRQGLDPGPVKQEYARQEAEKQETAKRVAEEVKAAKANAEKVLEAAQSGDVLAGLFSSPVSTDEVPEIPPEAKAALSAKLDEVNTAAADVGWTIPLAGEEYDGEGVNAVTMTDKTVLIRLASGETVECDIEDGSEIQRFGREAVEVFHQDNTPLPQELATTTKVSDLVLHLSGKGLGKDAIVSALEELKTQGHPAVENVADIGKRVGRML